MTKKLKNIETFNKHTKKFSLSDVMAMLPTDKESEQYANENFGYDEHSSWQKSANLLYTLLAPVVIFIVLLIN